MYIWGESELLPQTFLSQWQHSSFAVHNWNFSMGVVSPIFCSRSENLLLVGMWRTDLPIRKTQVFPWFSSRLQYLRHKASSLETKADKLTLPLASSHFPSSFCGSLLLSDSHSLNNLVRCLPIIIKKWKPQGRHLHSYFVWSVYKHPHIYTKEGLRV
jgi:hypothetical protein